MAERGTGDGFPKFSVEGQLSNDLRESPEENKENPDRAKLLEKLATEELEETQQFLMSLDEDAFERVVGALDAAGHDFNGYRYIEDAEQGLSILKRIADEPDGVKRTQVARELNDLL